MRTSSPTSSGAGLGGDPNVDLTTDSAAYTANAVTALRELIRQNFNHPAIAFWGIGNEQSVDDAPTNALLATLAAVVRAEDPGRLSTYASAVVADRGAVNGHTDVSGYNRYSGWYGGHYDNLGEWADRLHAADPARRIAVSEYGAGAAVDQHAERPGRSEVTTDFHPEEYQALLHEASWRQLAARPYLWGSFVWTMFDFASDIRAEGGQRGINDKGLVTRDRRIRKDALLLPGQLVSAADAAPHRPPLGAPDRGTDRDQGLRQCRHRVRQPQRRAAGRPRRRRRRHRRQHGSHAAAQPPPGAQLSWSGSAQAPARR